MIGNRLKSYKPTGTVFDKLIIVPEKKNYSDDAIRALTEFQERFFESIIIQLQ